MIDDHGASYATLEEIVAFFSITAELAETVTFQFHLFFFGRRFFLFAKLVFRAVHQSFYIGTMRENNQRGSDKTKNIE